MSQKTQRFEFGEFLLDTEEKVLLYRDAPVHIPPKVLQLLTVLIENHGHIVEKRTLMERVWSDSFVEDGNLTFTVRQLRKLLGDERRNPIYIETIPKRGYRFIGTITERPIQLTTSLTDPVPGITPHTWRSRIVFLSALGVLIIAAIVSGGFYAWNGTGDPNDQAVVHARADLSFETVISSPNPLTATISLDGRYIAYTGSTGGRKSLWLRQVATGINTQIVAPTEGVEYHDMRFAPDGEHLYFSRRFRDQRVKVNRVSIFGGTIKEGILDDVDGAFNLSPNGDMIAFRRYTPSKRSLHLADIGGRDQREIFSTSKSLTGSAFSPDGKTIAFASGQADTGDRDFGLYTIDPNSLEVTPATDFRWRYIRDVIWLPDQRGILVTARVRNEPQQVWLIRLSTGEVKAIPEMPVGTVALSATKDLSQLLVTQTSRSSTIYLASPSEPDQLRPVTQGWGHAVWSPENDIVYDSLAGGNDDIWLVSADMRSQIQLTTESSVDFDPQVSPDGQYIAFVSDRSGRYGIWRMNFDGSEPVQLTHGGGEQSPRFTPDGGFVIYNSMDDLGLWRIPVNGGEPIQVLDPPAANVSISHDGTKLANFVRKQGAVFIVVRDFTSGKVLREFGVAGGSFAGPDIRWSRDGSSLFYVVSDVGPVDNLWQQPIGGGPPRKLTSYNSEEIYSFDFSSDDSQLAITRGFWNHDTLLVKGFRFD